MHLFAIVVALLVCNAVALPWESAEAMPELVPLNVTIESTFCEFSGEA